MILFFELFGRTRFAAATVAGVCALTCGAPFFSAAQEAPSSSAIAHLKDLETFQECAECPEMVVLPPGDFMMGADDGDEDEKPPRLVSVPRFAIAQFETTFAEWDACAAEGYCRLVPGGDARFYDEDFMKERPRRPIIEVSWRDIVGEDAPERGFVAWLNSKVDGAPYRLPSEAEWEYAARAGTATRFSWGDEFRREMAASGAKAEVVGSYPSNAWGLHDMHGNVWEWVQDCLRSYPNAPSDGSAWRGETDGECLRTVVRGGSWRDPAWRMRSSNRSHAPRTSRSLIVGFRVARSLPTR